MMTAEKFRATDKEFTDAIAYQKQLAELCLEDGPESMAPHLYVLTRDPVSGETKAVMHLLQVDFNDADVKEGVLFAIGKSLYEQQRIPVVISLASEAWMSVQPADSETTMMPSEDPNRQEVVVVHVLAAKRSAMVNRPVKRDGEKLAWAGEWEQFDNAECVLLKNVYRGFFDTVIGKKEVQHG